MALTPRAQARRDLTTRGFADGFVRVHRRGSRVLGPMQWHPEQERLIAAIDERDPVTGLPLYPELFANWCKKSGKSTTAAVVGLAELVCGSVSRTLAAVESYREIILIASTFDQAANVVFAQMARLIAHHPWLTKHLRVTNSEIRYSESVVDHSTGGRHLEDHVVRAVAGRDAKSLHGSNASLVIIDELWTQPNYDVPEALAASPARQAPRSFYLSYAGLRSQMKEGVPIYDYTERGKRGEPGFFYSYIGGDGPSGWRSIPWITPQHIAQQQKLFAAVPSKFKRLWLNESVAGDEAAFLSAEEIAAATESELSEAPSGISGTAYTIGIDLGLTYDWAALVLSHVDQHGRVVVDAIRSWVGTRTAPVSVMQVEEEAVSLAGQFAVVSVTCDVFQAALLAERLRHRLRCKVNTVPCDSARLDRFATQLKGVFSTRKIRIPAHPDLIEQLETIVGEEMARRDRVRFTSGKGTGAGRHDDIVIALCLSMEGHGKTVGRAALPVQSSCDREFNTGRSVPCYLWTDYAGYVPSGDPSCATCPSHLAVMEAWRASGPTVDLRTFRRLMLPADNELTGRKKFDAFSLEIAMTMGF